MTDSRIVLVTGASQGIGRAAAKMLAAQGHHVVAVARSKGALESLDDEIKSDGGRMTLVPLDLSDFAAIDRLGGALFERFSRIDGLLANAGVLGQIGPVQSATPSSFENVINVNLTANYRLIRSMHPLLLGSDAPRAVFVTSGVATSPRAHWGAYQASKAGLEAMVLGYADENKQFPLRVNLFNPGATRTAMRALAMPGEDPQTLPTPEDVAEKLIPLLSPGEIRTGERINYRDLA